MAPQDQQNSTADIYNQFGSSSKPGTSGQGVIHFDPNGVRVLTEGELTAFRELSKVAWTSVVDTQKRFLVILGIQEDSWGDYRLQLSEAVIG